MIIFFLFCSEISSDANFFFLFLRCQSPEDNVSFIFILLNIFSQLDRRQLDRESVGNDEGVMQNGVHKCAFLFN